MTQSKFLPNKAPLVVQGDGSGRHLLAKPIGTGGLFKFFLWILLGLFFCGPLEISAQRATDATHPEGKWEVLDRCCLVTNWLVDGDSFRVLHKGREYGVRIYFVDAPEVDGSFKGRMRDQAAYFGIAPEDVPRAGELAARFTFAKLSGREFTVQTRWQNAMGRGKLARFYCEVLVDGKNLGEELVANGLARIYGLRAARPDGTRATTVINQLKNLELIALEQKRGIWDEVQFPRDRQLTTNSPTRINPAHAITADAPLDVNTASYGDLQNLPRIGPKMAQRIIAHRPYQRIEDLQKVPGIGPKTFEQITPFVRVSQTLAP